MKLVTFGVLFVVISAGLASTHELPEVPAIFVFGDELVDVGNNKYLNSTNVGKANYLPYGIDFPFSKPTGRFSNGYNSMDYIAKKLGFLHSPPPYLSFSNSSNVTLKGLLGANFASAGSGILDNTGNGVIAMARQIEYFALLKGNITAKLDLVKTSHLLSKSIFVISAGSNDINATQIPESPEEFYNITTRQYEAHLTKLYDLGARKFAVIDVPVIGCTPAVRRIHSAPNCSDSLNNLAQGLNNHTKNLLQNMTTTLGGFKYSVLCFYNLLSSVIANPEANGFTEVAQACCGFGEEDPECTPNAPYCPDRRKFVFWDGENPTETMGRIVGSAFYNGPLEFASPINLKQLAQEE